MFKFLGSVVGIIFIIGLLVVIGLFALIFLTLFYARLSRYQGVKYLKTKYFDPFGSAPANSYFQP
ncbi:hypothetical protein A9E74_02760 [Methylophaga muralis]|uniref:Uncharacterized protein n=1 Tax=Methylophaga muralis TaxID=291169 RepID=A0A1E3GN29_9GAMM|nr:hypothetical protein A9E74_02760 [Methylophaga muralis]